MGDLPKLLTRAFAIGYLLPAGAFVLALAGVFDAFGRASDLREILGKADAMMAVVALVALSFGSILLLALNRPLIRILEGYGRTNPARLWLWYRRRKYRELQAHIDETRRQWDEAVAKKKPVDPAVLAEHANALSTMAAIFPDREDLVLATKFGNILRAFEVYPRVVYGIESTIGVTRLHGTIPKEYRELINDEKSQVDFWVNLWFTGCAICITYVALALIDRQLPMPWIPFAGLAIALGAARGAIVMAYSWGVLVMSAFDLFREDLAARLGLKLPRKSEDERAMWELASQVWVYRSAKAATRLDAYRTKESRQDKAKQ